MSAKNVWGKVVLFLKERRQVALHVACGDITDVELKDNLLIINVNEGMLINLLSDGKREIENALRWQGLDIGIQINVKKVKKSEREEDLEKLKEYFGDYLIVRGGNKNGLW